jgi:hypothetical protein
LKFLSRRRWLPKSFLAAAAEGRKKWKFPAAAEEREKWKFPAAPAEKDVGSHL